MNWYHVLDYFMRTISAFGGKNISCYKVCVTSTSVPSLSKGKRRVDQGNIHDPGMILMYVWLRKAHLRDRKRREEARVRQSGIETGVEWQ